VNCNLVSGVNLSINGVNDSFAALGELRSHAGLRLARGEPMTLSLMLNTRQSQSTLVIQHLHPIDCHQTATTAGLQTLHTDNGWCWGADLVSIVLWATENARRMLSKT
jgi:hypothetical protein